MNYHQDLVSRLVDALHARVHYPGHDGHRAFQDDNQLLIEARAYLNSMKDNEHSN